MERFCQLEKFVKELMDNLNFFLFELDKIK